MDPVTVNVSIGRPPAEVFEYLADIANHPEFSDHYLRDWRLTREDSYGEGAGARYRVRARAKRFGWADVTFIEVVPPYKIVGVGRGGKYNRIKTFHEWVLAPGPGGGTRVQYTTETEPVLPTDRLVFPGRGWFRRKTNRALKRLRDILEEDRGRGARATVAGL